VIATAGIALLVAGCGGPSPEERYAESVCATTLPWAHDLLETYDDVRHIRAAPGPDSRVTLWALTLRGKEITKKYRVEVGALPVPDTDADRDAATWVEAYARMAFDDMSEAERRVRVLPRRITLLQSIRGLDQLEFSLNAALTAMKGTPGPILAERPELERAFANAGSCKELGALGSD
jgi:hypothetical protein